MSTSYFISAYATGKRSCFSVAKPCPTLCDPLDCSLPGFPVPHHLLEFTQIHVCWIGDAIQSSHLLPTSSLFAFNVSQHQSLFQSYLSLNASLCAVLSVSVLSDFCNPMDLFYRQKYWSGLPFAPSGDLPNPGMIQHLQCLLHWQKDSLALSHLGSPKCFIAISKTRVDINIKNLLRCTKYAKFSLICRKNIIQVLFLIIFWNHLSKTLLKHFVYSMVFAFHCFRYKSFWSLIYHIMSAYVT